MPTIRPRCGHVYTLDVVQNDLILRDDAFLLVRVEKEWYPIQNSCVGKEELLAIPGFAETQWEYIRETEEWIPLFRAVDTAKVMEFLDVEREIQDPDLTPDENPDWWVTLKAFPSKQYFAK